MIVISPPGPRSGGSITAGGAGAACGGVPVRGRHAAETRDGYGYRDFAPHPGRFAFTAWLYRQAWADEVAPSVLFRAAHRQLLARRILLPGHSVLMRLVATVRERATHRGHSRLARAAGPELRAQLEKLLLVPEGHRRSELELLRRPPFTPTLTAAAVTCGMGWLVNALAHRPAVEEVQGGFAADRAGMEGNRGTAAHLMRPPGDPFRERLVATYPQLRRSLPRLIEALDLEGIASAHPVPEACHPPGDSLPRHPPPPPPPPPAWPPPGDPPPRPPPPPHH